MNHLPALPEPHFLLKWRDGAYYVTKPDIGNTDVFTADQLRERDKQIVEMCAVVAWATGMQSYDESLGMPRDPRTVGSHVAAAIRALLEQQK